MNRCPLCLRQSATIFFESRLKAGVRSDWAVLAENAVILRCAACGHLSKPAALVRKCSDYQNYHFLNDATDRDKLEFTASSASTRSSILKKFLSEQELLNPGSRTLDFGCNRGAFLACLDGPGNAGYDVSEHYRPLIEKLGARFFTPAHPPVGQDFDVMTLIHVLEHLENPSEMMADGFALLKKDGALLIEVPDIVTQPTDIYVMDHFHHFTARTLDLMLARLSCTSIVGTRHLIKGELTGLYRRQKSPEPLASSASEESLNAFHACLVGSEEKLIDLKKSGASCVAYGAGLIGSLAHAFLGPQLHGFIDDNPLAIGGSLLGKPIMSFDQFARREEVVVVTVPPTSTSRVEEKLQAANLRYEAPFHPATVAL